MAPAAAVVAVVVMAASSVGVGDVGVWQLHVTTPRLASVLSAEEGVGVAASLSEQRVVVLADWPQPATVPEPRVLADDTTLSVMYRAVDDRYAVIRFPLC